MFLCKIKDGLSVGAISEWFTTADYCELHTPIIMCFCNGFINNVII